MRYEDEEKDSLLEEIYKLKKENQNLKKKLQSGTQCSLDDKIYKTFFENNTSVMLLIDPETGDIIDANLGACTFYGYDKNQITNMNISQINMLPKKDLTEAMNSVVKKVNNQFIFQHRLISGKIRDVEVKAGVVEINNKKYLYSIVYDISERKYYKRELIEKIEMEKLRTELFANISHELRTPLNVILGSLQLAELYIDEKTSDTHKRLHRKIKHNCYRLLRLINNMIDITEIDAGCCSLNLENFNIIPLVRDIVLSAENYTRSKGLQIQLKITGDNFIIACDVEKIETVVLNLLSNAVKFTEPGGKIKVSISSNSNYIVMSVKDSGVGMPEKKLQHIFERFAQIDKSLKRSHEGVGIGLSLVQSIISLHNGHIRVNSQEGKGSEFIISLPIRIVDSSRYTQRQIREGNKFNIERMYIEFSDIYI